MNETSIAQAGTNYRKGVIFGLTMAEVLLLLIFCLLLFMATLNKKINKLEEQLQISKSQNLENLDSIKILERSNLQYQANIETLRSQNSQYEANIETLKNQNSRYQENIKALDQTTSVPKEVYDVVQKMNDEELRKYVENSDLASTLSPEDFVEVFEKAEQWDTVTSQPQNLEVNKLTEFAESLNTDELNKLIENSELASTLSPEDFDEIIEKAEQWDIVANQPQNLEVDKITEFAETLNTDELNKLIENSELASTLSPEDFNEVFEKAEQWDTVTNQPQNPKVDIITDLAKELKPEQLNKLIENAYVASQTDAEVLDAALEEFNKPKEKPPEPALAPIDPEIRELAESVSLDDLKLLAEGKMEEKVEAGNNWPPIISLPEAENYSFKLGSAQLTESFKGQLSNEIVNQILRTLSEYDADLIEVIGHTDLQPMSMARVTNLDKSALEYFETADKVSLRARDNAGLGYARALSVTKHLLQTPELKDYTILPYSAAQMVTPNHTITTKDDKFDSSQLRRIEIRVRRQNR